MRALGIACVSILTGCAVTGAPVYSSMTFTTASYVQYDEPAVEVTTAELAGGPVVDVDVFFDRLEPYGRWYDDASYGWVFVPASADYVPYSNGYWSYGDAGMVWVSNDPFGWATDHYGRWVFQARWIWIPDTTWGPAWVSWRIGDGWIGWAPCGYGSDWYVPDDHWRFVEPTVLFAIDIQVHYLAGDARRHVRDSVPIARYRRHGDDLWPAGPSEDWMRRNRVDVTRRRFDAMEVGRFDPERRARDEDHARTRQQEWDERRARVDQIRRGFDDRWRRERADQARMVDDQRRALDEQRRIDGERRRLDQAQIRVRDDADRRALEAQQRQLDVDRRRLDDQQRARRRDDERGRIQAEQRAREQQAERGRQQRDQHRARQRQLDDDTREARDRAHQRKRRR